MTHPPQISHIIEGLCLGVLAVWQGGTAVITALTESDWSKLTGPHGVAFASVIAVIVLWGALLAYISKSRKEELAARKVEDESRERRHVELVTTQTAHANKLIELTEQSITANINGTHAIQILSKSIEDMAEQVKKCPGQNTTSR